MNNTTWSDIHGFLSRQNLEFKSTYSTGFNTWEIKKDLYMLQEHLDQIMEDAPTYAGETEWLAERKTKKAFNKLGNS